MLGISSAGDLRKPQRKGLRRALAASAAFFFSHGCDRLANRIGNRPVSEHPRRQLVLVAMIFAVAMTFIDQTIVAIAVPELQKDLALSATGVQWIINGYLLALSALFAFGGRLSDIAGHRRMVVIGVVVFATASALCGATPEGGAAEPWIIVFRVIQGVGAALMYPAALAIVIDAFPLRERGRAMAIFFAVAGGLTSVGPIAGGYLSEWTWRAIFWVNIPVAIIALVLIAISKPAQGSRPARLDYRGAVLIAGGMGLAVLGLQQSATWGWGDAATWGTIVAGMALLVAFLAFELRADDPLIQLRIFRNRGFAVENTVLLLSTAVFVPLFFFASMYAQISLGEDASTAGLYLLIFFAGFATASQLGGRILDARGARPAVVVGCLVAAAGFALWGRELPDLDLDSQWPFIVLAGAGTGLMFGPVNTDAINRAPRGSYGEVSGVTQTVRNFGASIGLAVMGTILILTNKSRIESSLESLGLSRSAADDVAHSLTQSGGGDSSGFGEHGGARAKEVFEAVQLDFALASRTVFYVMAGLMLLSFLVGLAGLPRGRVADRVEAEEASSPAE
jgi:EmrB/QacA subfamily drug resistance transporter